MCVCYAKSSVLVHLPSRALRVACFWLAPGTLKLFWWSWALFPTITSSPDDTTASASSGMRSYHLHLTVSHFQQLLWDPCTLTSLWGGFNILWIRLTSDKRPEGEEASKSIWLRVLLRLHTTQESTLFSWRLWPGWQRPSGRCFPFFLCSFPFSLTLLPWITCPVINSLSKELRLGQSSSSNRPHVHPFAYPRNCDIHCFPKMTNPVLLHFLWEKNQRTDGSVIGYCLVTALSKLNS